MTEYRDTVAGGKRVTQSDLEKAFLEAAEIAKKLPKNLQETGFGRALDRLLGGQPAAEGGRVPFAGAQRSRRTEEERDSSSHVEELLGSIDRTSCPDIGATARVADRALKVLHLVHQEHDVDGLTAGDIAEILSRKFRLPVKANSVTKALERETQTVDVRPGPGGSHVFHIMAPGEEYVKSLRAGASTKQASQSQASRRPRKRSVSRRIPTEKPVEGHTRSGKGHAANPGRKVSGRPGPKAAVGQLIETGFFRSARTIAEIQEELKHRRGHAYTVQELAPALVRSVRDESLSRGRNQAGQYEYTEA